MMLMVNVMVNRIAFLSASGLLLMLLIMTCSKRSDKGKEEYLKNVVTDTDGNKYHTITLGTQVWMVENLNVSRFRNGDQIGRASCRERV